jgi:cyclic pyranopterin phosphate synthase
MMSTKPLLQNQLLPDETNETFRSGEPRIDSPRRTINYLRLSVTDRCNLRCMYCMPEEGIDFVSHTEVLSYEEMLYLVRISVGTGIRKVRLTGGEPLVRRGFISFLERLSVIDDLKEITLTTNGVLLKDYAAQIKKCGICRINVSLDSLRPDRFMRITRRDLFQTVWEGIEEAERLDFHPVKINVVAMKGINDDEVLDFARLTLERPLHVRFIEFMPIGEKNIWSTERFISSEEIFNRVGRLGHLEPVEHDSMDGPAERYRLPGARGEVGFISAVSNHFCHTCNRLRLTADGRLRGCLFSDREIDVKTPLRQGKGEGHIAELMRRAVEEKPKGPTRVQSGLRKCIRQMSSIGG